ncbi:hypothetical protein RQP53_00505 [Paucibacter sp. APW11]|uniref:Cell envelope biogenesis protein TolA n=1 Tax=Roseateles aquae TaxID=3077235 RepID=A0ABU3P598_9BURK|nr:hypothetical protein [Paucibacter sp. APW11]MDT8997749.1 hypothetical protein [Paucibacter sp. APW11]
MNKPTLHALSAAILISTLASSLWIGNAVAASMNKADYKAAKDNIASKYKADKQACNSQSGNARDICIEEAKGAQNISGAELEQNYEPSEKHSYELRLSRADAAFAIAKERCDDMAGNAKDVCRKQASSEHVKAKADAKLAVKTADANADAREKTDAALATAKSKTNEARADASADKREAAYALAKQKCDSLAGDAKANCLITAKTDNHQP